MWTSPQSYFYQAIACWSLQATLSKHNVRTLGGLRQVLMAIRKYIITSLYHSSGGKVAGEKSPTHLRMCWSQVCHSLWQLKTCASRLILAWYEYDGDGRIAPVSLCIYSTCLWVGELINWSVVGSEEMELWNYINHFVRPYLYNGKVATANRGSYQLKSCFCRYVHNDIPASRFYSSMFTRFDIGNVYGTATSTTMVMMSHTLSICCCSYSYTTIAYIYYTLLPVPSTPVHFQGFPPRQHAGCPAICHSSADDGLFLPMVSQFPAVMSTAHSATVISIMHLLL